MYPIAILFWLSLFIVSYAFIGYGFLIYFLVAVKRRSESEVQPRFNNFEPPVSLVIPCYNEANILREKILNCKQLDYPAELLKVYFITDGSTDDFRIALQDFPDIVLLHEDRRGGKTAAENRAMTIVDTPIVIFSDANTMLNR